MPESPYVQFSAKPTGCPRSNYGIPIHFETYLGTYNVMKVKKNCNE